MEHMGFQTAAYSTAIYCRLSKDDGTDAESTSIGTQKMMLEKYCHEQGYSIYDVYADVGYSGLNYNRPDFNRMLTDIDNGKINLIVTKDLSRLGRDYIQTGYYTEMCFVKKKVRYIAVNDGIDTIRQDNDIAPFRNILNDLYAKDLSRKVKSAKRQRAYSGYFISAQTAYGYKIDPTDKTKLMVDNEPAEVVREMYRLALAGYTTVQITRILTARGIPTPSAYKVRNGDTRFIRQLESNGKYHWCNPTVQTILRDRVYVGDMENRKTEILNYKTKERVNVPKDQRIVVENTHEPLVSRDDWNRVQDLIKQRHKPHRHNFSNVFKSIIFCSECGHSLTLMVKEHKTQNTVSLHCRWHYTHPNDCKNTHYIRYEDLYSEVLKRIRKLAKSVENGTLLATVNKRMTKQSKTDKLETEKAKIGARLSSLAKITKQLYEDNACSVLDTESYHTYLNDYQNEKSQLSQRLQVIETELNQKDEYTENLQKLSEVIRSYMDIKELNTNMLNQLVERIEVGHVVEVDGEKQQEINIIYRFIGTKL